MNTFQAISWDSSDVDFKCIVRIFGRNSDGKSVALSTNFTPYLYVKTNKNLTDFIKTTFWRGLVSCKVVNAKDVWGFQNEELSKFYKITFDSQKAMRNCAWCIENDKYDEMKGCSIYEANMDPILRFMHCTDISSTGWINPGLTMPCPDTQCDVNIWSPKWSDIKPVDNDTIAPLRISSIDIECYSSTGNFPDAKIKDDVIFQIALTTKIFGKPGYLDKKCLCLKETTAENCESFKTEKALLVRFEEYLKEIDPDVITGWNIFGFDLEYMLVRATYWCKLAPVWGRLCNSGIELVTKNLSSSALGNNELKMVPMKGRYVFDLYQDVKREHKLESYSLNNVAKKFLGDQKNDMPVSEIFRRYKEGSAKELGEVAEYCIKDTELPQDLMIFLFQIQNQIEMAKACWVPLSFLSERGQQIKVYSQMAYNAKKLNFILPTFKYGSGSSDEGYQGATVLEAQTGAYYSPITALDFASLYPSIMRAHNLCYSTIVMNPKYDNLPGVVYEDFGPHRFAQNVSSLLPSILTQLSLFRKKAKGQMKEVGEFDPLYKIYDARQLAFKVSMNSIYGFTGAIKGMLPLVAIASSVTMQGRKMIEMTKECVEANFQGAKVRYGDTDSVMVEFDVQGRKGQDAIDYSWEQGNKASKMCSKLFKAPNDLVLEKVYCPYFLYSKKRYAAKMYVMDKNGVVAFNKIDIKGLQVVRRDSCAFVRDSLMKLLEMILESSDPRPPIEFARKAARDLRNGDVPIEQLLLSKKLAASYKVKMPHVEVRDKMKARAPGTEPQQGDRVAFVIAKTSGTKMYEKAEDPKWLVDHKIPIDYEYYFTNQLLKPVQDILEPLIDPKDIFNKKFINERNAVVLKEKMSASEDAKRAFLKKFSDRTKT